MKTYILKHWLLIIGAFLLFIIAISLTSEAADLIITSGTDASGDAVYDDGWIDSTYWLNGWDIEFTGDLLINATGLVDGNASASLTVGGTTTLYGTMDCGPATMSLRSGGTTNYGIMARTNSTFIGGSGTHVVGSFYSYSADVTFTSGTMTLNGHTSNNTLLFQGTTFDDGDGTVAFTYTGNQLMWDATNTARTLYNVVINKASGTVQHSSNSGFALTVANVLTVTSGTFDTSEAVTGTSRDLTVTGRASVTDTLDLQGSTVIIGVLDAHSGSNVQFSSATTTINDGTDNVMLNLATGSTMGANSGTIVIDNTGGGTQIRDKASGNPHHLTIIGNQVNLWDSTASTYRISGNLTVGETATFRGASNTRGITVSGGIIIEGGTLGHNTWSGAVITDWIQIGASGTYTATTGNTIVGDITNSGTFTDNSGTVKLGSSATFSGLTGANDLNNLNLNGKTLSFNETIAISGTITSGGNSALEIGSAGSWSMNQNVSLHHLTVLGSFEIDAGGLNLTFTNTTGFTGSTGSIYINGTASSHTDIYSTVANSWGINASALSWWRMVYVDAHNGTGSGSQYLVILGENYTCSGMIEFTAPLITINFPSNHTALWYPQHRTFTLDIDVLDLSIIHTLNWSIKDSDGVTKQQGNLTYIDMDNVSSYSIAESIDTSGWDFGTYTITIYAADAHNKPVEEKAIEKAKNLTCYVGGNPVSYAFNKKISDKETDFIYFADRQGGTAIYALSFYGEKKAKHEIEFTDDLNFKMGHYARTEEITINEGEPIEYQIIGVHIRVQALKLDYLGNSNLMGHFVIYDVNGVPSYFYDMQDFWEQGGQIIILGSGSGSGIEWYDVILHNPTKWKDAQKWEYIDPISGVINSRTVTSDFTITWGNERFAGHEEQDTYPHPLATVIFGAIMITLVGVVILNPSDKHNITPGRK